MSVTDVALPSSRRTGCYGTVSRQPAPGAWALRGFLINLTRQRDGEGRGPDYAASSGSTPGQRLWSPDQLRCNADFLVWWSRDGPSRLATSVPGLTYRYHMGGFIKLQKVFDCVRRHSRLEWRRNGRLGRPAAARPHPANRCDSRYLATHLAAAARGQSGLDDTRSAHSPPEHCGVEHGLWAVYVDDLDLASTAPRHPPLAAFWSWDSPRRTDGGGRRVLWTHCLRCDRLHTGRTVTVSPAAFACRIEEHSRGLVVVACLLRCESGNLAHLVGACARDFGDDRCYRPGNAHDAQSDSGNPASTELRSARTVILRWSGSLDWERSSASERPSRCTGNGPSNNATSPDV